MKGPRVFADYLQRHALFVSEVGLQVLFLHQTRVSDSELTNSLLFFARSYLHLLSVCVNLYSAE